MLECAIRELEEELCITPVDPYYAGHNQFQFTDGYSMDLHAHVAFDFKGNPSETEEAIPNWFPLDQIPYEKMWDDEKLWLPLVLKRKNVKGRYLYHGEKVLDHHVEYL